MACNDCITRSELETILNNWNFGGSSGSVPVGARMTIGPATYNAYFDPTGLGGLLWTGWAVSNGNNGTSNRLGKFPVYYNPSDGTFSTAGSTGGSKTVTLTQTELPGHTHGFSLPNHSHSITDNGHTHSVTNASNLSTVSIGSGLGSAVLVSNSFYTTLLKQEIRLEDSPSTITNPIDIEVYVPVVNKQSFGLSDGSDNKTLGGSGSVTVPSHTHTLTPSSLAHTHTATVSSNTSGISIGQLDSQVLGTTTSTGSGQPFSILPPYIVEIPVEKIA